MFAFRAHYKAYGQLAEINFMHDDVAALTMNVRVFNGGSIKRIMNRFSLYGLNPKYVALSAQINCILNEVAALTMNVRIYTGGNIS